MKTPKLQTRTIEKYKQLIQFHLSGMNMASTLMKESKQDRDFYYHSRNNVRKYAKLVGIKSPA